MQLLMTKEQNTRKAIVTSVVASIPPTCRARRWGSILQSGHTYTFILILAACLIWQRTAVGKPTIIRKVLEIKCNSSESYTQLYLAHDGVFLSSHFL